MTQEEIDRAWAMVRPWSIGEPTVWPIEPGSLWLGVNKMNGGRRIFYTMQDVAEWCDWMQRVQTPLRD